MTMEFRFIRLPKKLKSAYFGSIQNFEGDYQLFDGKSLKDTFPDDVYFEMRKEWGKFLGDFVNGIDNFLIISDKAKGIIEQYPHENIEFLSVGVYNHKKRLEKAPYWLLNLLDPQDCLDEAASRPIVNHILPDQYSSVEKLVIAPELVKPDVCIFRIHKLPTVKLIREDVASHLEREGCTGFEFYRLEDVNPIEDIR